MTTWFTSDLHFGHRLVAHLRGHGPSREEADVTAHDLEIADHWRDTVATDDVVWILGDLDLNTRSLPLVAALPGRKRLIAGNHDACHPMHSAAPSVMKRYLEVFEFVQPFARVKLLGEPVLLSHFPYQGDHTEYGDRFTQYRLPDEGARLLHGHTHSSERWTSTREIHVGWDAWRRFVSADELAVYVHLTASTT
jgi:calcineurin-like phosphoesterase family protein